MAFLIALCIFGYCYAKGIIPPIKDLPVIHHKAAVTTTYNPADMSKEQEEQYAADVGHLGPVQMSCLVNLWDQESGWRVNAVEDQPIDGNPPTYATGIPQALPADKMASAGADWRTNPETQIRWGLGYINGRYGSPCGAWAHEQKHDWY